MCLFRRLPPADLNRSRKHEGIHGNVISSRNTNQHHRVHGKKPRDDTEKSKAAINRSLEDLRVPVFPLRVKSIQPRRTLGTQRKFQDGFSNTEVETEESQIASRVPLFPLRLKSIQPRRTLGTQR